MTGQTISHYRVFAKLGEGGMGVVYKAEDTKLGRTVALKFLTPHALDDAEAKERFLREARAAASLDHPNVCTVYEIGEEGGQAFLAMVFIDGQTVKAKIAERPLKLDEALDIAIQAGEGLRAAHEKGIVHRDIKSANLMVTPEGRVKVMDFGLAHLAGQDKLTKTGATLGTPAYMSPEQLRSQRVDRRTDIWSLGVVLYEMIAGRLPFCGEAEPSVMYAILNEEPEPPTALRSGVPIDLDRVVGKALAKNADERYQHVEEMLVDLSTVRAQVSREEPGRPLPRVEISAGQTLGHYRLEAKLGEGGMGVVYRARDTRLGRLVAIKALRSLGMANEERKRRFVQEAKAASALNQRGIVTIHDISTIGGVDFIIMEYVDGQTLDRTEALAPEVALDYAIQIAEALAAAHQAGIVHRDIKPANIMVTESGRVKVLDFGLAKLCDPAAPNLSEATLTEEGAIVGTVAYMSPEQAQGNPVEIRSDVFSFGVVLYEMLAGRRPFQGDSPLAVLSAILHQQPAPLKQPSGLEKIVLRCLEKDPARRYASAAELKRELAAYQSRVAAPPPWRKPRLAIPALAVLMILLALGTWLVVQNRRQSWARNVALPEIDRLLEEENYDDAFRLAQQAERYIPADPALLQARASYARAASVDSTPPGADVYVKGYRNIDADWLYLGQTPINGTPVPGGFLRWKVTKEGYVPAEGAFFGLLPRRFSLHPPEDTPPSMVPAPGGDYQFRDLPEVKLEDFWLDKYEVTNEQFQQFVDQGGYQKREYWKHPFLKEGKAISWEQAMAEFVDTTGRPAPATWELGTYPEGRGDFPVNGVSWYEAAAYAEFAGKNLPTVYHWLRAAPTAQSSDILWLSNFGGPGPAQAGSHEGLSPYGSYDMAGNVREWCWNAVGSDEGAERYILGASWNDAPYRFPGPGAAHPWDRSPANGFRCAKYGPPAADLTAPIERMQRDLTKEKPVDDEIFEVYRSFYSYEPTDLEPQVEEVDDSAPHWRREKVSFNAAYGGERVIAYLFLPRNARPPYQTIVYFASGIARLSTSSEQMGYELRFVDFLPRIGRAVLFLVYKGTYERNIGRPATEPWDRDLVICWSRDFSRAIDYLETRPDIDHRSLGYFSFSNPVAPVLSAIDGRIKAAAHLGTGLFPGKRPPEFDPLHFAPRAKEPTLILGGRYDFIAPVETSQLPLLRLLGAPQKDKRLALFDTGHVVRPGPEVIKEVLDWFDRYLGPVEITP